MLIWFRNMLSMSSSAVCGRSSQSGEVNCAQKLARSRHSRTIISSTCSQLIFVIAVLGPDNIVSDTSMFWFSGSCVSPISVWGMLLLCPITFALDPQVFFHPVFRSQENKLENTEKLGRLNIFWILNIFGPDHLIFFTVLLRSRNWTATESCKLELETRLGTGFA